MTKVEMVISRGALKSQRSRLVGVISNFCHVFPCNAFKMKSLDYRYRRQEALV